MKNKFIANIILCKSITKDKEFNEVFNSIVIEEEPDDVNFDVGIFLTSDIKETTSKILLVNILHEKGEGNVEIFPIATLKRTFDEHKKDIDLLVLKARKIQFKNDGLYEVEVRICEDTEEDLNEIETIKKLYDNSELINSFAFSAYIKK